MGIKFILSIMKIPDPSPRLKYFLLKKPFEINEAVFVLKFPVFIPNSMLFQLFLENS